MTTVSFFLYCLLFVKQITHTPCLGKWGAFFKKIMKHEESTIQIHCVRWFNLAFPEYQGLLYSVPNGGQRNAITAKIMKAEGVVSGVSDLNLDVARNGYHGLRIEMKTAKGKQSENQKIWQAKVEKQGYLYIVCHSVDEFIKGIKSYL